MESLLRFEAAADTPALVHRNRGKREVARLDPEALRRIHPELLWRQPEAVSALLPTAAVG
jgi:hypothetical protein